MNATIQDALNDQIQAEFASAYTYLAMSARFEEQGLGGFAHWMRRQWEEETAHAMKFYDFVLRRDGTVDLQALDKPEARFDSPLEAFEQALAHEQYITRRIHELYDLAMQEQEYALRPLLHWFIEEQNEEEESVRDIVDALRLIGDDTSNLFMLDRELAQRQAEEDEEAA
jgi:ferritin